MQLLDGQLIFSATDLIDYLACAHLVSLERDVAQGKRVHPETLPGTTLVAAKGERHELLHLARLRGEQRDIVELLHAGHSLAALTDAAEQTIEAMQRGAAVIYQATFFDGQFSGRADFLIRVDRASRNWPWSYEVVDTKLALSEKPALVMQLCHYSEHLGRICGTEPVWMHVVLGDGTERRFRVNDFSAYYRHCKASFLSSAQSLDAYPIPCSHCATCEWSSRCEQRRRDDDHLSLVASIRREQIVALEASGIGTLAALAAPNAVRPSGLSAHAFTRLHRQAALQARGRESHELLYHLLDQSPNRGFSLLPEPAPGDLFFDMEGDPLFDIGTGLEYLFGVYAPEDEQPFHTFWGTDRSAEKRAFEACVDFFLARRTMYPNMHIYHYAPYEKTRLRTLSQRHQTRQDEVDQILRSEMLVDLYAVARQSVMISQASYSIKNFEPFYGMQRTAEVRRGDDSVLMFEYWLANQRQQSILDDIALYNEEDCRSTFLLREWLLERRREYESTHGVELLFKPLKQANALCHESHDPSCPQCLQRERDEKESARRSATQTRLLASDDPHAVLLGNLLSYHRNEEKPAWWALFDRCENIDTLIEGDHEAIGGLTLREDIPPVKESPRDRSLVYTYAFPAQTHHLPDRVWNPRLPGYAGTILSIDDETNLLRIKSSATLEEARELTELIPGQPIATYLQRDALARIADAYCNGSLAARSPVTLDLLRCEYPHLHDRPQGARLQPDHVQPSNITPLVHALAGSYLILQGPPGTGKTYTGARLIHSLIMDGKRVGVMASTHKAIHTMLHEIETVAMQTPASRLRGAHKFSKQNENSRYLSREEQPLIVNLDDNAAIERGDHTLISGNSWLFAREGMIEQLDYLFIDEAGQTSLADAIAVSPCARNIVLLGDPMQLAQVSQGVHADGAGKSVLEHLLGEASTVAPDRGILLDVSYRMHPDICGFISDMVYDGRLRADSRTHRNAISAAGFPSAGLASCAVTHTDNARASMPEAEAIIDMVERLLEGTVTLHDAAPRALLPGDMMIVTPFNAQRKLIQSSLVERGYPHIRVGTVDTFQGQEAPIVFYSMATSSGENVPRNMEFLFEKNRFNVAISRAQCMSIVVHSPALLDVRCNHVEQIRLVNLLCRYMELSIPIGYVHRRR